MQKISNEHELDTATLKYVSNDLEHNAKELERLADAGLIHDANVDGQVKSLRAMSFMYGRIASRIEASKSSAQQAADDVEKTYDPNGNEADDIAYALGHSRLSHEQLAVTLVEAGTPWCAGHNTPRVLLARILSQLSGPGKRFIKDVTGQYRINQRWKSTLVDEPLPEKRPRDFMSQAISIVLRSTSDGGDPVLSANDILNALMTKPGVPRLLKTQPTKPKVADTLSAGSRGPNPRFIRVKRGLYRNNPKYKKAK